MKQLLNIFKKPAAVPTVTSVLEAFHQQIDSLEAIAVREAATSDFEQEAAAAALTRSNLAKAESDRAKTVATKIRSLIQA